MPRLRRLLTRRRHNGSPTKGIAAQVEGRPHSRHQSRRHHFGRRRHLWRWGKHRREAVPANFPDLRMAASMAPPSREISTSSPISSQARMWMGNPSAYPKWGPTAGGRRARGRGSARAAAFRRRPRTSRPVSLPACRPPAARGDIFSLHPSPPNSRPVNCRSFFAMLCSHSFIANFFV